MASDILHALAANLLSPAVLFFALGLAAALLRSDLKFPEALYVTLTIYLLTALGFKGGVAISEAGIGNVILPALAAMTWLPVALLALGHRMMRLVAAVEALSTKAELVVTVP